MNNRSRSDIGVLGAGITGCCLALELARKGFKVDLIDQAPEPMMGASLHNEGKLHLGFVYANDPLRKTHSLMLRGSLAFSHIIEKLTGDGPEAFKLSRPFHYFVPVDSQLDLNAIEHHFREVEKEIHEETRQTGNVYLNCSVDRYFEKNATRDHQRMFSPRSTLASYRTEERSVSPVAVAAILSRTVRHHPNVNFVGNATVLAAHRLARDGVEVELARNHKILTQKYCGAANCLWDGRLEIDRTAGIDDQGSWMMRYKATINISTQTDTLGEIPSATGILGPYGDVVNHNNGAYYISWYPHCKLAQSINGDGRQLHDRVHQDLLPRLIRKRLSGYPPISRFVASVAHRKFVKNNIKAMAAYIPSMKSLLNCRKRCEVGGGVILARGATDIDDPNSILHQRSVIGPVSYGSYVTIDTGKYCTAPLFALEAADMIMDVLS